MRPLMSMPGRPPRVFTAPAVKLRPTSLVRATGVPFVFRCKTDMGDRLAPEIVTLITNMLRFDDAG